MAEHQPVEAEHRSTGAGFLGGLAVLFLPVGLIALLATDQPARQIALAVLLVICAGMALSALQLSPEFGRFGTLLVLIIYSGYALAGILVYPDPTDVAAFAPTLARNLLFWALTVAVLVATAYAWRQSRQRNPESFVGRAVLFCVALGLIAAISTGLGFADDDPPNRDECAGLHAGDAVAYEECVENWKQHLLNR